MTLSDCFEMGRNLYNDKNYKYAAEWFIAALDKVDTEDIYVNVSHIILRDIVLSLHEANIRLGLLLCYQKYNLKKEKNVFTHTYDMEFILMHITFR